MKNTLSILFALAFCLMLPNQAAAYVFSKENDRFYTVVPPQYKVHSDVATPQDSTETKKIRSGIWEAATCLAISIAATIYAKVKVNNFAPVKGQQTYGPIGWQALIVIGIICSFVAFFFLLKWLTRKARLKTNSGKK